MSSASSPSSTSSARPGGPTGGPPDNNNGGNTHSNNSGNNNNTLDTFMGTNVYLYGFLSTLILIFLVSVAVAYKGYRTRALLRQRIDEALAAGVFIPGVSPDDGPGSRRRREAGEKPVLNEVWLHRGANHVGKWDELQPLSLQPALQLSQSTSSEPTTPLALEEWAAQHPFQRGPRSLFSRHRRPRPHPQPPSSNENPLSVEGGSAVTSIPVPSDGIRQLPTPALPPTSSPSRPNSLASASAHQEIHQQVTNSEPQQAQAVDVPLLLGIMIAMPDPSRPQAPSPRRSIGSTSTKGKERESDSVHGRPHDGEESGELPELMLGYADVPLVVRRPAPLGSTASASAPPAPPIPANQPSRKPSVHALSRVAAAVRS